MVRFGSIGPPMHPIELFVPGDTYLLDARSLNLPATIPLNETHFLRRKDDIVAGRFDAPVDQDVTRFIVHEPCELVGPAGAVTEVAGVSIPEVMYTRYVTLTRDGRVLVPFVRECTPNRLHAISTALPFSTGHEPDSELVTLWLESVFAAKVRKALDASEEKAAYTEQADALAAVGLTPTLSPVHAAMTKPDPVFRVHYGNVECPSDDALPSVNAALKRYYTASVNGEAITPDVHALHRDNVTWSLVPLKKTAQYDSIVRGAVDTLVTQRRATYHLNGADAALRNFTYQLSMGALASYAWARTGDLYKGLPVHALANMRFAAGVA